MISESGNFCVVRKSNMTGREFFDLETIKTKELDSEMKGRELDIRNPVYSQWNPIVRVAKIVILEEVEKNED